MNKTSAAGIMNISATDKDGQIMDRKTAGRFFGASVFRAALCVCCALVMLLAAVHAAGEGLSWEERLEKAREKYNEKTVHVYIYGRGSAINGRINVRFYRSYYKGDMAYYRTDMNIGIRESLQITDEAEMQAVLEVVAKHKLFSEEEYGTISLLKAEWITHNLAYEMANGSDSQKSLVAMVAGEKISKIIRQAKELDISTLRNTSEQEMAVYEFIESVYCHKETGESVP